MPGQVLLHEFGCHRMPVAYSVGNKWFGRRCRTSLPSSIWRSVWSEYNAASVLVFVPYCYWSAGSLERTTCPSAWCSAKATSTSFPWPERSSNRPALALGVCGKTTVCALHAWEFGWDRVQQFCDFGPSVACHVRIFFPNVCVHTVIHSLCGV